MSDSDLQTIENGGDGLAFSSWSAVAPTYQLTGQDITFKKGYILTAEQGTYTLSGQDATLTYTTLGTIAGVKLKIGGAWYDVSEAKINVGDVWRDVTEAKINVGDVWRTIF